MIFKITSKGVSVYSKKKHRTLSLFPNLYKKISRRQQGSNMDRQSRRRVRCPLPNFIFNLHKTHTSSTNFEYILWLPLPFHDTYTCTTNLLYLISYSVLVKFVNTELVLGQVDTVETCECKF